MAVREVIHFSFAAQLSRRPTFPRSPPWLNSLDLCLAYGLISGRATTGVPGHGTLAEARPLTRRRLELRLRVAERNPKR